MPGLHFELNAATVEFLFISDSPGHKLVEWALVVAFDEETIDRINRGSIRHDQTTDVLAKALLLLRGVKELVKMIGVSCPATEIPEPEDGIVSTKQARYWWQNIFGQSVPKRREVLAFLGYMNKSGSRRRLNLLSSVQSKAGEWRS